MRSPRVVIIAVILVAILIVGAVAWLAVQSGNNEEQHPSEYTKHSPILINGNSGFTNASGVVQGSGTASDPYIIANWYISASNADGIWIQDTDAHFTVRNCQVHNGTGHSGIYLSNCINGALENNNCSDNYDGIYLVSSSNNTLSNNSCSSNSYNGITLVSSNNNTLSDNNCSSNDNGGITLALSSNNTLSDNNCSSNACWGIGLGSFSINNEISWNQISNNVGCGVDIYSGSNNRIWYNIIIGNNGATGTYNPSHAQARDDGTNNRWNGTDVYGNHGNYWSDWRTPDAVSPHGIVDQPYIILGSAGAKDYYPLTYNPLKLAISSISSCLS